MRQYSNFDEIERDLKLLKLRNEIDKERIFLAYNHTKESMAPTSILKRTAGTIFKSVLIYKGATKVMGFVSKKLDRFKRKHPHR